MAKKLKLKVDNMMCEVCVANVTKALDIDGVSDLSVKIGSASLSYDEAKVSEEQLIRAVVDAGFPCRVKKGLF
ncbi:Copper chaperone [Thermoplasmatales archaeon BRNA1]|nr:Copper chaperone [Thermoplasmatales archaeon BRNA1]